MLGSGHVRTLKGPSSADKLQAREELSLLSLEEHLDPHCEQHIPPVRIKLCLALGLAFLQQSPNLLRHPHHEMSCSLAVAHLSCWVGSGWRWRGERSAGVLAAIGIELEGSVARAERQRQT